jgi:hypothetical protein
LVIFCAGFGSAAESQFLAIAIASLSFSIIS